MHNRNDSSPTIAAALAVGLCVGLEAVDVRVGHNKAFDFKADQDLGLESQGAGDVIMARTQQDDAAAMKAYAEPLIRDAVATEMTARGLQPGGSRSRT